MPRARPQKYAKGALLLDGLPLAELTDVSITHESGASDVATMAKGWSGENPGVQKTTWELGMAVPVVGQEVRFIEVLQKGDPVELCAFRAGRKVTSVGFCRTVREQMSVANPTQQNISFSAGPADESVL